MHDPVTMPLAKPLLQEATFEQNPTMPGAAPTARDLHGVAGVRDRDLDRLRETMPAPSWWTAHIFHTDDMAKAGFVYASAGDPDRVGALTKPRLSSAQSPFSELLEELAGGGPLLALVLAPRAFEPYGASAAVVSRKTEIGRSSCRG